MSYETVLENLTNIMAKLEKVEQRLDTLESMETIVHERKEKLLNDIMSKFTLMEKRFEDFERSESDTNSRKEQMFQDLMNKFDVK